MKKQNNSKRLSLTIIATAVSSLLYANVGYAACSGDPKVSGGDDCQVSGNYYYTQVVSQNQNSKLTFTDPSVFLQNGHNNVVLATDGGKIQFDGNVTVTGHILASQAENIVSITSGSNIDVAGNLTINSNMNDGAKNLYVENGELTVRGNTTIEILPGSKDGIAFRAEGNSKVKMDGITTITNNSTTPKGSRRTLAVANNARTEFNVLNVISQGVVGIDVNDNATVTSTGNTLIYSPLNGALHSAIWFNGTSLISLGEAQNITDQLEIDRANDGKGKINIGSKAKLDAYNGIIIMSFTHTDITIKGEVISQQGGDAIWDNAGGNETVIIEKSGKVKGDIRLLGGNDSLVISGTYDGHSGGGIDMGTGNDILKILEGTVTADMIFMGTGNDHIELSGGKVTSVIFMDDGNDTAKIANAPDLSGLEVFSGGADGTATNTGVLTFEKHTGDYRSVDTASTTGVVQLHNWNEFDLTDHSSITFKGTDVLAITDISGGTTIDVTKTNDAITNNLNKLSIDNTSTLNYDQNVAKQEIYGSVDNNGLMTFGDKTAPGKEWHVKGNYSGTGTLVFNTQLNDDNTSPTDKLVIDGDTSGTTKVKVFNVGGTGAATTNGIELIVVNGISDANAFVQDGRIVGGAYDYKLQQGDAFGANTANWYLTSYLSPNKPTLRPEGGAYVGMQEYNRTAFNHSFHDRQQLLNNEYESSWGRIEYTQTKYKVGADDQLDTKTHKTLIHLGSDFYQDEQLHLGIMGGYSNGNLTSRSNVTHYRADGQSDGYSLGLYGTWFDQAEKQEGWYVDSWLQYNWFKNKVKGQEVAQKKYNTHGISASLETGYSFILNEESLKPENQEQTTWTLEPQAQIIYNNLSGAKFTDSRNTRVKSDSGDMYTFRAGLRLQGRNESGFQPFATLNYWYTNNRSHIDMDGTRVDSHRSRYLWNTKVGGQYPIAENFVVYGQVQGGLGEKSTKMFGGDIGLKYTW